MGLREAAQAALNALLDIQDCTFDVDTEYPDVIGNLSAALDKPEPVAIESEWLTKAMELAALMYKNGAGFDRDVSVYRRTCDLESHLRLALTAKRENTQEPVALGARKGLQDDKLPHRPMLEVELADALIRIFDIAGGLGLDVAGALAEKLAYNAQRADHRPENRAAAGGKKF